MKWGIKALNSIIEALLKESVQMSKQREISRHLSRIALFELKGVDSLYPDVKQLADALVEQMRAIGMPIYIVDTYRSAKKQNDTFAKGRSKPGRIVTNAEGLESYHQYGLAFDVAFVKYNWNPPVWNWWTQLGAEGEKLGLVWGGDFKDYGHFEWRENGIDWKELKPYFEVRN